MILVIDNYDSFTFNLVQALEAAGAEVRVVRNDAIDRRRRRGAWPTTRPRTCAASSISPGPGDPDDAGVSVDAVKVAAERGIPLLGVCLGMQSMAAAYGGVDRPRADARPRRGLRGRPTTAPGLLERDAGRLLGGPLPLAVRRPGDAARRAVRHRDEPRGRRGDGPAPPRRCRWRASSSTPSPCSRPTGRTCWRTSCAWRARARPSRLDAATGSFATAGMAELAARPRRPASVAPTAAAPTPSGRPMSDAVRAALAAIVDGRTLSIDEARLAMGAVMDGEATPVAARGAADGPPDARRDGRGAGGLRDRDARAGAPGRGARGHDRRRRHRRRRLRHVQHLDHVRARRRRDGRARRQARQPGDHVAGRARPTCSTPSASASTTTPTPPAPSLRELGFAFLFAPSLPPGDAPRRPDPPRDRRPDRVQPARAR